VPGHDLREAARQKPGPDLDSACCTPPGGSWSPPTTRTYGGFGGAPRFPIPHQLSFLLRYWKRTGEAQALQMVGKRCGAMRSGGIFDQVGFGLHRYSTDAEWKVPHFEKMLYDQALLLGPCVEAWQAHQAHVNFRRSAERDHQLRLRG
jgi:uncharacterized protein